LFPLLKNFGIEASVKINEEGYYPWGGGEAEIKVQPLEGKGLKPINILEPGKIKNVYIQIITNTNHQEATGNDYLKEIRKEVKKTMRKKYTEEEVDAIDFEMDYHYSESLMKAGLSAKIKENKKNKAKNYHPKDKGPAKIVYGILLFAYGENIYYDCSSVNNDEFTNDEQYIEKVLDTFSFYFASGSCMDEHLQDQLLIFMTLANGKSTIQCNKLITEHTHSCFYIFKEFFPQLKYEITEQKDSSLATIQVEGLAMGVTNSENKSETKEAAKKN